MGFFDWKWKADKDANSPEAKEQAFLLESERIKAENESLKAQVAEAEQKYQALQGELGKLRAEASEVKTLRADLERYKTMPAANSVADEVKGGFTPSAEGQSGTKYSWQEKFERGEI